MSYNAQDLSVLAYANGFTLWHYRTSDAASAVDTQSYFNEAGDVFRAGDMILANIGAGGSAVGRRCSWSAVLTLAWSMSPICWRSAQATPTSGPDRALGAQAFGRSIYECKWVVDRFELTDGTLSVSIEGLDRNCLGMISAEERQLDRPQQNRAAHLRLSGRSMLERIGPHGRTLRATSGHRPVRPPEEPSRPSSTA